MVNERGEPIAASPESLVTETNKDDASTGRTKQAEKSRHTRQLLLDSTVECLVENGFLQTTTQAIAQRAKLSRGAMMHHFDSRLHIIGEVARYLAAKLTQEYDDFIRKLALDEKRSFPKMSKAVEMLQTHYSQTLANAAWQELLGSARANRELRATIAPLQRELDEVIARVLMECFPNWRENPESEALLQNLFLAILRSVIVNADPAPKSRRMRRLNELLVRIATDQYERVKRN
ncbi:TetR/AcrR family transcriptional regulator [Paraburkholderia sp. BR14374]|uniref:TetR/AcrR family transcriptional regulator n=1 Tax=Paraburkholderia sp. BR14374 TaxID=3237007 RepID=UPI0034CDB73C